MGCLRLTDHLSAGAGGNPPYSLPLPSWGPESKPLNTFTLSPVSLPPKGSLLFKLRSVGLAFHLLWPPTGLFLGDPQPLGKTGLFFLPAPLPGASLAPASGSCQDSLHRSLCSVHGVAAFFAKSYIIKHRSIFFLTENLNIYRLQRCPLTWILLTHRSRAAAPFIGTDITCLTLYHQPGGDNFKSQTKSGQ